MTGRRKTLSLLVASLCLALGTPALLALFRPDMRFYLLQPVIFAAQTVPYVIAAGLWLPWRSPRASGLAQRLAVVFFGLDVLLYGAILTGLLPTGGDMVGMGYLLIALGTTLSIIVVTAVAFTVLWLRDFRKVRLS